MKNHMMSVEEDKLEVEDSSSSYCVCISFYKKSALYPIRYVLASNLL